MLVVATSDKLTGCQEQPSLKWYIHKNSEPIYLDIQK